MPRSKDLSKKNTGQRGFLGQKPLSPTSARSPYLQTPTHPESATARKQPKTTTRARFGNTRTSPDICAPSANAPTRPPPKVGPLTADTTRRRRRTIEQKAARPGPLQRASKPSEHLPCTRGTLSAPPPRPRRYHLPHTETPKHPPASSTPPTQ